MARKKERPPVAQSKERPPVARVIALVGPLLSPGFRLAGVKTNRIQSAAEMERAAERLLIDREKGIVLLDRSLFQQLPEMLQRRMAESTAPHFLPIPTGGPSREESATETDLARLIRRAIGYQVKIRR